MFKLKNNFSKWPKYSLKDYIRVLVQMKKNISIYDRSGIIEQLEESLKKYFNSKHALLTNSGTTALFSVFNSLNLTEEDEVLVPSYTFFATVTPFFYTKAKIILIDSDETGCIDYEGVVKNISRKTKLIVLTHMWGYPCKNLKKLLELSKKFNIPIVEDVSHAHGAKIQGKKLGTFGLAGVFSIQGQKTLTGGEGGFIITNNDELFYNSLMIGHYNKRCKKEIPKNHFLHEFYLTGKGLKFRIHPLAATIALGQLEKLDKILYSRSKKAKKLYNFLESFKGGLFPLKVNFEEEQPSWYSFIIKFDKSFFRKGIDRKFFVDFMNYKGFEFDIPNSTRPLNLIPLFQNSKKLFKDYPHKIKYTKGDFPNAERFHSEIIKVSFDNCSTFKFKKCLFFIKTFIQKYGGKKNGV